MFDKISEQWVPYLIAFALAIWGGTANYISRLKQDESLDFKTAELVGEWIISSFAGICVYLICQEYNLSVVLSAAFAGIAGHQGSRTLFILELWFKTKMRRIK